MSDEIKWLIGFFFALCAAIGGFIVRDRQQAKMVRDAEDKLHARISKVERDFVRRVDLHDHLTRTDRALEVLREDFNNGINRLERQQDENRDLLIKFLAENKKL